MPHVLTLDDYEEVNNECEYSNWVEQASPSYVNGVPTYLDAQGELIEGIYLDMPNDVYHALPALSSSKLKKFIDSPAHYYREYLSSITRKRTTAMQNTFDAGTHAHTLVLEPEGYYERYFRDVMPIDYPDALHTAVQIEAALVKLGLKKSCNTLLMLFMKLFSNSKHFQKCISFSLKLCLCRFTMSCIKIEKS